MGPTTVWCGRDLRIPAGFWEPFKASDRGKKWGGNRRFQGEAGSGDGLGFAGGDGGGEVRFNDEPDVITRMRLGFILH